MEAESRVGETSLIDLVLSQSGEYGIHSRLSGAEVLNKTTSSRAVTTALKQGEVVLDKRSSGDDASNVTP